MGLEIELRGSGAIRASGVVDIHLLSHYVFDSREAVPEKEDNPARRTRRLQSDYLGHGLRTRVAGVLLVELFEEPHILLLQVRNSLFKLPGGKLHPGEPDIEGLKRKLSNKLSPRLANQDDDWQIGEYLGMCWSDFDRSTHPHTSSSPHIPKEGIKIFLVRLLKNRKFVVPRNLKILAIPLVRIKDRPEVYGPVISMIPDLLSGFSFNKAGA